MFSYQNQFENFEILTWVCTSCCEQCAQKQLAAHPQSVCWNSKDKSAQRAAFYSHPRNALHSMENTTRYHLPTHVTDKEAIIPIRTQTLNTLADQQLLKNTNSLHDNDLKNCACNSQCSFLTSLFQNLRTRRFQNYLKRRDCNCTWIDGHAVKRSTQCPV